MINRILSPKNQEPTTPNALPELVTFLTKHKNNSTPEKVEEDIKNEESTEDETTVVKEIPRKNPFLAKMKYHTVASILKDSDDSKTKEEHSQDD